MSEIDLISSLLDKVAKKQRVDTVPQRLDEMLQILDSWEDSGADDDSRAAALASLGSKLEAVGVAQGESSTARELESSVRKLGKTVCKAMPQPTLPDVPLPSAACRRSAAYGCSSAASCRSAASCHSAAGRSSPSARRLRLAACRRLAGVQRGRSGGDGAGGGCR